MKRFIKLTLATATLFLVGGTAVSAQQLKFGYVDTQELMGLVIRKDGVEENLQRLANDYEDQLELMQVEGNRLVNEYQRNLATMTDAQRADREAEIRNLESRIRDFAQNAEMELGNKQQELIGEVARKIKVAVEKVGAAGAFFIVMDVNNMLYFDSANMTDLTAQVKRELGV
jgi:outer membrane protein